MTQEPKGFLSSSSSKGYEEMFQTHWYENVGEWFTMAGSILGITVLVVMLLALPLSLAFLVIRYALTL